ncbi:rod shape-determining protein RodA, partial [Burkholderia contaminans]
MQFDKRAWLDKIKQTFAGFHAPPALSPFPLPCGGIRTACSRATPPP